MIGIYSLGKHQKEEDIIFLDNSLFSLLLYSERTREKAPLENTKTLPTPVQVKRIPKTKLEKVDVTLISY